ncbi:MAG: class I SAM-dependent methyltransferase [Sedimenticola sp.]|nr:class I SAM-dependent methyltransferase [Sedimenticola sp.]
MSKDFQDHFSTGSSDYSHYRPVYPVTLFHYLATLTPSQDLAWDCATGNGQAARQLARHFQQVIATDASRNQIEAAIVSENIDYRVAPAEQTDLGNSTVDLVTVAQALHWFDLDRFYAEVKRVLNSQGVIAIWTYNLFRISPAMDELIDKLYHITLNDYWPEERRLVENGYADLAFPFEKETSIPAFAMTAEWTLSHLLGYLRTWSAVTRHIEATGEDPVTKLSEQLEQAWGDPKQTHTVEWPLSIRIGFNR